VQVITTKGAKSVTVAYDGDRTRISVVLFICADGTYLTPIFLIKGSDTPQGRAAKAAIFKCWSDALFMLTDAATQTEETFFRCMQYFNEKAGSGNCLLLDSHSSRVSLDAIQALREAGNVVFTEPHNGSHVYQPCDKGVIHPIKLGIQSAIDNVRLGDPDKGILGVAVTMNNVVLCIREAFKEVLVPKFDAVTAAPAGVIVSAFRATGLEPWKPSVVKARQFAAAVHFDAVLAAARPAAAVVRQVVAEQCVEIEAGEVSKKLKSAIAAKARVHCVPEITELTGDAHVLRIAEDVLRVVDERIAVESVKVLKMWAKEGWPPAAPVVAAPPPELPAPPAAVLAATAPAVGVKRVRAAAPTYSHWRHASDAGAKKRR
jgi:hypothetical protein